MTEGAKNNFHDIFGTKYEHIERKKSVTLKEFRLPDN